MQHFINVEEPYITKEELIRQLIAYLSKLSIKKGYIQREFKDDINRLEHLRESVLNDNEDKIYTVSSRKLRNISKQEEKDRETMLETIFFIFFYMVHLKKEKIS